MCDKCLKFQVFCGYHWWTLPPQVNNKFLFFQLLLIIQSLTTLNSEYLSRSCVNSTTTGSDLSKTLNQIEQTCFYAVLLSFLLLLLSRYFVKWIIWGTCIGAMFVISVVTIAVWKEPNLLIHHEWELTTLEVCAIKVIPTMILIVGAVFLILYRREIRLVGYLFKELSKETLKVSSVIFQPVLTCLIVVLASYFSRSLLLTTDNDRFTYPQILSLILYIWFISFVYGCQNFMIAGAVSKCHQEQDKTSTKCPFWSTIAHLIYFHLGNVCCGRFIAIFKPVVKVRIYWRNS